MSVLETLKKNRYLQLALIFFSILSFWWFTIFLRQLKESLENSIFTNIYGVMAFYGGILGFFIASKWGGKASLMGRVLLSLSGGLFCQFLGQLFYIYYIYFLKIENPYPSIGDMFFTLSVVFYLVGTIYLAKIAAVHLTLQSLKNKAQLLLIPLFILILSYWFFLKDLDYDWSKPISVFLDFIYPLGQAGYISVALIVYLFSKKILGGLMKIPILLIITSLVSQYFSDFIFTYLTYKDKWYAGGIDDYLFFLSYTLMTLSIILSGEILNKEKNIADKD